MAMIAASTMSAAASGAATMCTAFAAGMSATGRATAAIAGPAPAARVPTRDPTIAAKQPWFSSPP